MTLVQAVILAAQNAMPRIASQGLLSELAKGLVFAFKFVMLKN